MNILTKKPKQPKAPKPVKLKKEKIPKVKEPKAKKEHRKIIPPVSEWLVVPEWNGICFDKHQKRTLVKRIIATGGQTVYIDYDANTITVDGQVLDESYLNYEYDSAYGSDCMADLAYLDPQYVNREFTVPDGCIFVCGDNRNHSSDSRSAALGMVDARYVIGEVLLVFLPFNHLGLIK